MANSGYNSSPFTKQFTLIQKIKELQDHVKIIYDNEEQFNQRIAELESKSINYIILENVDLSGSTDITLDFSAGDFGKAGGIKNCKLFIVCSYGPSEYGARKIIFELSRVKHDLSLNEISFSANIFDINSDDKYVDTISAVATFSLQKIRIKFARVSLNFNLETIPHIFEIDSETDVTSVFNQVKTGDMINQNDTMLYIIVRIQESEIVTFVIDYESDSLGYSYYELQQGNWLFNNEISFNILKSSIDGTKLYKHTMIDNENGYKFVAITQSDSPIDFTIFNTYSKLYNYLKNSSCVSIINEQLNTVFFSDYFCTTEVVNNQLVLVQYDDWNLSDTTDTVTKL